MITIYLKEYRKKNGLTQAKLAELMNVHENTIRRWETGDFEPRLNDILKLCGILKITANELLNAPSKQDFKVNILIDVISLSTLETENNSFTYCIDNSKPIITFCGTIRIGTSEQRKNALDEIIRKFKIACCLFDKKAEIEAET